MPSARKRTLHEVDTGSADTPKEPSLLQRIRNMWQFANLCQWIVLFGKAVKVEEVDISDLEAECLKPYSMALQDIGLSLLKYLSSHRGLTHDLFEEYTRRQFIAKAPNKNPFGDEETPSKFADFDVFGKIRVLQQMTQLIMMNPERLREKTEEQKDLDQTNWRIEPYGWDRDDRTYFVLDDNRIYRLTEPPPEPAKPKKNSKKAKAAARASKRRRISAALASDADDSIDGAADSQAPAEPEDDGLGGMKWECVAVTLDEVRQFVATIQKTKDENEKILRDQIEGHLVPILEKQEESRKRKQLQREKDLLSLEKMAHAKRSSRIANKIEQHKVEEQQREEERKRREQEEAARKEAQKLAKMERERDNRLLSRERRLKERESRRQKHQEELAQLSEDSKKLGIDVGTGAGRMSERRLQAEIEKRQLALKEIEDEEDDWMFDCVCGVHGQIDDGTHSVACERCNVWQHSKCLGISEEEAEKEDFHLICNSCRRREQAEKEHKPRIIKLKVNRPSLPTASPTTQREPDDSSPPQPNRASQLVVELPGGPSVDSARPTFPPELANRGDTVKESPFNGGNVPSHPPLPASQSPAVAPNAPAFPGNATTTNSVTGAPVLAPPGSNPFSSPHPTLSPPDQSPNKSRAYHSIYDQPSPLAPNGHAALATRLPAAHQPTSGGKPNPLAVPPPASVESSPLGGALKTTPPSLFPGGTSGGGAALSSRDLNCLSSPSAPQPQFTPNHREPRYDSEKATPLPPSRGGLSPTKHSPPLSQQQFRQSNGANGISPSHGMPSLTGASPKPTILPPGAALSPSPPQQILTPPIKHVEPARPAYQQQQQQQQQQHQQQGQQGPLNPPASSSS